MHKIQSQALYAYLKERGVLDKSKEDIAREKNIYRRKYKSNNAKKHRINRCEIRFHITKAEFRDIKKLCDSEDNVTPTSLARELLLTVGMDGVFIPSKHRLFRILKQLGIAINQMANQPSSARVRAKLLSAEQELLDYLHLIAPNQDAD